MVALLFFLLRLLLSPFTLISRLAKAEQQLATLEDICLIPWVETEDLKRAIAAYNKLATR